MTNATHPKKPFALLSVSERTGILPLARTLRRVGFELVATSGTAEFLSKNRVLATGISDITKFPEVAGGRVKTLHPKIHAGILCERHKKPQLKELDQHNISLIDLVAVNLYPFEKVVGSGGATAKRALANIDIGGVALLRAAAKNYEHVVVLCEPTDYKTVAAEFKTKGEVAIELKAELAQKAFSYTARYDRVVADYFAQGITKQNTRTRSLHYIGGQPLRYGENPHQQARLYFRKRNTEALALANPIQGKPMSYNNVLDAFAAVESIAPLPTNSVGVALVKHGQPCGIATGKSVLRALQYAWEGDPKSAYGSVGAASHSLDERAASFIEKQFVEVFAAPKFSPKALALLSKKRNLRLIECSPSSPEQASRTEGKFFGSVLLEQEANNALASKYKVVTKKRPKPSQKPLFLFAFGVVKQLKSNAVCVCYEYEPGCFMCVGTGTGQTNRIEALTTLAIPKAKETLVRMLGKDQLEAAMGRCVLASDGFFPFDDSIVEASKVGLNNFIQPGGSVRDADIVKTCDTLGAAMVLTGTRHFKH